MGKIMIFDEYGDQYEVTNIEAMLNELDDINIEMIYKPTRYHHELQQTIMELQKRKVIQQIEGPPYNVEAVERGLKAFEGEIIKRFGKDVLKEWQVETDAQWEENKKDLDKR